MKTERTSLGYLYIGWFRIIVRYGFKLMLVMPGYDIFRTNTQHRQLLFSLCNTLNLGEGEDKHREKISCIPKPTFGCNFFDEIIKVNLETLDYNSFAGTCVKELKVL